MSLKGNASASQLLRGSINKIDVIHTDTYQIAVANGFKGTVDEWLASLKGDKGDKGEQGIQGEKGERGNSVIRYSENIPSHITIINTDTHFFNYPPRAGDFVIAANYELFLVKSMFDPPYAGLTYLGSIKGQDGEPGYTPVRGTDYWTDADKEEIKSYVDEAILGGAW